MKEKSKTIKQVKKKLQKHKSKEKSLNRSIHVKIEAKQKKTKLEFLGWFMYMHEQPCVRSLDYMHVGFYP